MAVIEGAKELERKLLALERKTAKKIVRSAVRKGSKVIVTAAKANAVSMVGGEMGVLLRRNIIVRAFKRQKKGSFGVRTTIRPQVKEFVHITKGGVRHYVPSDIEYGHDNAAAIPFMRSASDTHGEKARQVAIAEMKRGLMRDARKKII